MRQSVYFIFLSIFLASQAFAAPQIESEECLKASKKCEDDTDCIHRLAVVQSACVTNTCQPQCRQAAMNLYQNVHGRKLLRSDTTCVPGRSELEHCGFLPNRSPKHCNFAKLICEADLQCNSKWEVFISECEAETSLGQCSDKCRKHLNSTLSTHAGAEFSTCSCTDKDDQLCIKLKDTVLKACIDKPSSPETPSAPATPSTGGSPRGTIPPRGRPTITPNEPGAASSSLSFSILAIFISFVFAAGIY